MNACISHDSSVNKIYAGADLDGKYEEVTKRNESPHPFPPPAGLAARFFVIRQMVQQDIIHSEAFVYRVQRRYLCCDAREKVQLAHWSLCPLLRSY